MTKLLLLLCVCPIMATGQISFIKEHKTGAYFDDIARPCELSNGNFVCSVILKANNVSSNVIYLMDECGEISEQLLFSTPSEFIFINSFVELDSTSFLASGYIADSVWHSVHFVLDNQTLEIKQKRTHFEGGLFKYDRTVMEDSLIYQTGTSASNIVSTYMNTELQRNFHLYRNLEEPLSYTWVNNIRYVNGRIYTLEGYDDYALDQRYSIVRCMDKKLRDIYTIRGLSDTSFASFDYTIGFLHADTLMLGVYEYSTNGGDDRRFIGKYFMDSLIYSREIVPNKKEFIRFTNCDYNESLLKCVNYNGEIGWFNSNGDSVFYTDHLVPLLDEGDMVWMINTSDGGLFSLAYDYGYFDGVGEHILKIVKTTGDYQISAKPHPRCIVSIDETYVATRILLYPNPGNGNIYIESDEVILNYKIYNVNSILMESGKANGSNLEIELDLIPGMYIILLETKKGWILKKMFMVN